MANEEHPVIRGLRWILENRTKADGKKMSMLALSESAGRAKSQVEQILSGRQSADLSLDLARDLAKAGNVRTSWLLTGEGSPGQYEGNERTELDRDADVLALIEDVANELKLSDEQRAELSKPAFSRGTSRRTIKSYAVDMMGKTLDGAIADPKLADTVIDVFAENERKRR